MDERIQVSDYLVEIWERDLDSKRFRGNGGIVRFPDGTVHVVTAAHVIFKNGHQLNIEILEGDAIEKRRRGIYDKHYRPSAHYTFNRLGNTDIAETEFTRDTGLFVAEKIDLRRYVRTEGSIKGERFEVTGRIERVYDYDTGDSWSINTGYKRMTSRRGLVLCSYGKTKSDVIFPGSSGSLIFDSQNRVVGILTGAGTWTTSIEGSRQAVGQLLGN